MTLPERNSLIAEYFQRQLWQFISIDEWLDNHELRDGTKKEVCDVE